MKLSNFHFNNVRNLYDAYEYGYGYRNTPHLETHQVVKNDDIYTPIDEIKQPYVGYGWFVKSLDTIGPTQIIDMKHIMDTYINSGVSIKDVYLIFSLRKSYVLRPVQSQSPTYIGWCVGT